jgi:transmembrane protein 231
VSWGNANANGFNIRARIDYPNFQINYVPGFWENFKWGWIQYLTILIPFLWIFTLAKIYIFENQLVPTIVVLPYEKVKTH